MATIIDPITVEPDIEGSFARAWKTRLPPLDVRRTINPDDSTVSQWLIECPRAHPLWHSYGICFIHLRALPGRPLPKINAKDATHEVMLLAMDPDKPRAQIIEPGYPIHYLTPFNFAGQFQAPSDGAVERLAEFTVREITTGALNPDTDYRSQWRQRFGDSSYLRGPDVKAPDNPDLAVKERKPR